MNHGDPSERMETARPSANGSLRLCSCGCGKSFVPGRRWQVFYSAACRKKVHQQSKRTGVYFDVRETLNEINAKLDALLGGSK